MEENIVIGVDSGASHTKIAVWEGEKKIYSRSDLPGVNPDVVNLKDAIASLTPIMKELAQYRYAKWVVGMAGVDSKEEVLEANNWFRELFATSGVTYSKYVVFSDIELVLWAGGLKGAGIGLISGTGSNCLGRNIYGKTHKVGGMSHILSDEGGGFSLGWKCLHLITKMIDGRTERTPLVEDVLSVYDCSDLVSLKNFLVKNENMKVAVSKCAEVLLRAADRGEEDAIKVCADESLELVRMVAAVNSGLGVEQPLPVFLAGSLFRNDNYLGLFKTGLSRFSPNQEVSLVNPIDGALEFAKFVP